MCADHSTPEMTRLARWGLWLVAGTLAYNVVEAVVALWAGSEAGSIALFGFGLDSVIEVVAASALLWRLSVEARGGDPERNREGGREGAPPDRPYLPGPGGIRDRAGRVHADDPEPPGGEPGGDRAGGRFPASSCRSWPGAS